MLGKISIINKFQMKASEKNIARLTLTDVLQVYGHELGVWTQYASPQRGGARLVLDGLSPSV